jgi:hypothetical protein
MGHHTRLSRAAGGLAAARHRYATPGTRSRPRWAPCLLSRLPISQRPRCLLPRGELAPTQLASDRNKGQGPGACNGGRDEYEPRLMLLPSGRRLDLLNPDSHAWTDDLSLGLSRTYRWAGYSAWDLPSPVAQHTPDGAGDPPGIGRSGLDAAGSLARTAGRPRGSGARRLGSDTPLKPHLGTGFDAFVQRLQTAVAERYRLPAWTPAS